MWNLSGTEGTTPSTTTWAGLDAVRDPANRYAPNFQRKGSS
jgi:hypothetical protein